MNSNTSMTCFHQDLLVFSLLQKFSIIPEWHGSRTRRRASSLIVAEMCRNINTNEHASSNAGRIGLMLVQLQLLPFIQHTFFLPCSAAMSLQASKAKERCVKSLPCFYYYHGLCAVGFLHIYMCCVCDWFTQIVVLKILLFQKYTWTAYLDRHSFSLVLLSHFASLFVEILKKIGHTGIAGTKKWLDQAVFPCWSNYHTLAGE